MIFKDLFQDYVAKILKMFLELFSRKSWNENTILKFFKMWRLGIFEGQETDFLLSRGSVRWPPPCRPPPGGGQVSPGDLGSRIIISSCQHIISSYHHTIVTPWITPPGLEVIFRQKSGKNRNRPCYPSAKSRRDLKMIGSGVIFRDGSAGEVQNIAAPPKQAVCENSFLANFSDENFCQKFCRFFFLPASINEMSGIIWNAFSQSLRPNGAILGG